MNAFGNVSNKKEKMSNKTSAVVAAVSYDEHPPPPNSCPLKINESMTPLTILIYIIAKFSWQEMFNFLSHKAHY